MTDKWGLWSALLVRGTPPDNEEFRTIIFSGFNNGSLREWVELHYHEWQCLQIAPFVDSD